MRRGRRCIKAALSADPFPDPLLAAQVKIIASETPTRRSNVRAMGYSRDDPLERMVRDARMFTFAGGTAQVERTLIAARILNTKIPQIRNAYLETIRLHHFRQSNHETAQYALLNVLVSAPESRRHNLDDSRNAIEAKRRWQVMLQVGHSCGAQTVSR